MILEARKREDDPHSTSRDQSPALDSPRSDHSWVLMHFPQPLDSDQGSHVAPARLGLFQAGGDAL